MDLLVLLFIGECWLIFMALYATRPFQRDPAPRRARGGGKHL